MTTRQSTDKQIIDTNNKLPRLIRSGQTTISTGDFAAQTTGYLGTKTELINDIQFAAAQPKVEIWHGYDSGQTTVYQPAPYTKTNDDGGIDVAIRVEVTNVSNFFADKTIQLEFFYYSLLNSAPNLDSAFYAQVITWNIYSVEPFQLI